ncbi:MAG: nuclear transport factor 2 family protein [Saprospiraceae bacterium]|nr:nuclear transport factor 2 family protein [Saprospiraceae bacterium]MCB0574261.1 nuclear transport factor 2 family protein [Saprospiraceae bacterium]MCB9356054.1 nuclear transport factor 2 family protein [Lewinellaceae bacterium]
MKRLLLIVPVIFIMASCDQNQQQSQNKDVMQKSEKEKIKSLLGVYKTSLNTSDAKLAQSLYAKDGIFMPAGAPSAVGSEDILKSYEFIFSQIQLNIEFFIDEIVVEEAFAFATTSSKGTTLIHANGETVPEENRELFVFEKVNDDWKIARYMFNKTK